MTLREPRGDESDEEEDERLGITSTKGLMKEIKQATIELVQTFDSDLSTEAIRERTRRISWDLACATEEEEE